MPTIASGSSSTFTLTYDATIVFAVDQGESVSLVVTRGAAQVFGQRVSVSQSFGPFLRGDIVQITAQKGVADYTLVQTAKVDPIQNIAPFVTIRSANFSDLTAYDGRSFRQVWQTPFIGLCSVRAGFDTRDTSTGTWSSIAIAAGRDINEINPKLADGSDATPELFSAVAYTAADSGWATNGQVGSGKTGWSLQNIPAPVDGVGGGYIYTSVINSNVAGRYSMNGNANRPTSDWQLYINPVLPHLKYRAAYNGGADNVTTNHGSFSVDTDNTYYQPIAQIDIVPSAGCIFGVIFGDSKIQCMGVGDPTKQWHNYTFPLVACNTFNAAGIKMCVANFGFEGRTPTYYLKRWELLLADTTWAPDWILVQPISINPAGGYTAANIDPAVKETFRLAALSRARGTKVIFSGSAPDAGSTLTQDNLRKATNAALASAGYLYFDTEFGLTDGGSPARLKAEYTYDGTHYNRLAVDNFLAPRFTAFLKTVLGL